MIKIMIWVMVLLFSSQAGAQKIYKWVDENGQIHYSSQKPVDQEAETMKLKKAPKKAPKAEVETATQDTTNAGEQTDAEGTEGETEAEAAAKAAAAAELAKADKVNNQKQCDIARKNYAALNASVRVTRTNEKGEVIRMSDDERVRALQTAQQGIDQYCQ